MLLNPLKLLHLLQLPLREWEGGEVLQLHFGTSGEDLDAYSRTCFCPPPLPLPPSPGHREGGREGGTCRYHALALAIY